MPGKNSHTMPAKGTRATPKSEDARFMVAVMIIDFLIGVFKKFLINAYSTIRPSDMTHHDKIRVSKYKAGQTTSAKA